MAFRRGHSYPRPFDRCENLVKVGEVVFPIPRVNDDIVYINEREEPKECLLSARSEDGKPAGGE